ncbi:hypothetical protein FPRO05_07533 [Fusarium proliferatum]|uniref:Heterokaryon incompatibility domain-containing protein n=1 Tax=Gibberella intermedia TaxID=948311 RepID=A0A365NK53_GIBIN|nr:hypothetical protein FPRO05_07533 [Fusarium proliferatum]
MVDIYRHSFCNISATAASSDPSSTGLFSTRSLPSRLLFPFKIREQNLEDKTGFEVGPWVLYNDSSWKDEIENTPLNTRGWVVQERFLAPRILHFTKSQMYWECLETTVCEADPNWELQTLAKDFSLHRQPIHTVYKAAGQQIMKTVSKGQRYEAMDRKTYHTLWGNLVSIYANCALTKESDRLIAMSGIANEANKDTYLAGLWKEAIHSDLTWRTNASEGAEVVRNGSALHQRYSGLPKPLVKLVEERIVAESPGGDSTGLLPSAELDIKCRLFYYCWTALSTTLTVYKDEIRSDCYFEEKFSSQNLQLDTTDLVRKFKEMEKVEGACVPLCTGYHGYGGGKNVFMMLELVSGTTFSRVGIFDHGEIGTWISEWSGSRTRITLV